MPKIIGAFTRLFDAKTPADMSADMRIEKWKTHARDESQGRANVEKRELDFTAAGEFEKKTYLFAFLLCHEETRL